MSRVCDSQRAVGTVSHNGSSVCIWCQETRSRPSLVSSVFPDGGVRESWWKDLSCRVTLHNTSLWIPKFPDLTGDTEALVGFTVRKRASCSHSDYAAMHPDCHLMSLLGRYREKEKKLTWNGDASNLKSKRKKKWVSVRRSGCNCFDTCCSQTQLYFSS